jgi:hypothetical protein
MTFRRILLGLVLGGVLVWAVAASQLQHLQLQQWRSQENETVKMLGLMRERVLSEVSGLAVASGSDLRLWMHNDSGDRPRLFLVATNGKLLQEVALEGAEHRDWEDLSRLTWNDTPHLLVGDVGDNSARRETCQLYLLPEPACDPPPDTKPAQSLSVAARKIDFRYSDGPRNCEALGFDAESKGVILIEKLLGNAPESDQAGVYLLDLRLLENLPSTAEQLTSTASAPLVAERIGSLPWRNITALDFSADGRRLFVRTYFEGYLFEREPTETWTSRLGRELPEPLRLPVEAQGEAVCFSPDARSVVLTSEFAYQPLWEMRLPEPSGAPASSPAESASEAGQETSQEEVKRLILPGESFRQRPSYAASLNPGSFTLRPCHPIRTRLKSGCISSFSMPGLPSPESMWAKPTAAPPPARYLKRSMPN